MLDLDLEKALQAKMSRKQFLKSTAVGVIALTGITAALRAFTQVPLKSDNQQAKQTARYGASSYGGVSSSTQSKV